MLGSFDWLGCYEIMNVKVVASSTIPIMICLLDDQPRKPTRPPTLSTYLVCVLWDAHASGNNIHHSRFRPCTLLEPPLSDLDPAAHHALQ